MKQVVLMIILCVVLLVGLTGCTNLELTSDKVIDNLSKTNRMVVQRENDKEIVKTITDKEEIEKFINIISQADKVTGFVNLDGNSRYILMYNKDDEIIYTILVWHSGYIGFEEKEYKIKYENMEKFLQIVE